MVRNIVMLVTCVIVGGLSAWILLSFLRKLKKIEDDFWGTHEKERSDEGIDHASGQALDDGVDADQT